MAAAQCSSEEPAPKPVTTRPNFKFGAGAGDESLDLGSRRNSLEGSGGSSTSGAGDQPAATSVSTRPKFSFGGGGGKKKKW